MLLLFLEPGDGKICAMLVLVQYRLMWVNIYYHLLLPCLISRDGPSLGRAILCAAYQIPR